VSPRIFPAGVHRFSEHVSTGRALNWVTRGQPLHPGLVALPGSGDVLETPGAALGVPRSSLTGATGGHVVERVGSGVTASFIQRLTLRHEPGSQPPREGSDVRPVIGFFHGHNLGEADEQDVAENLRGLANVRS